MIYLNLFLTFFKIGALTFGGGYAMLPLIQSEVINHGWMQNSELVNFIAVSESTPGPFAVNISTYIGSTVGGVFGAVCATAGVVLPSFLIILLVVKFYDKFQNSTIVKGCMTGLRPAVVGLIATAVISVGSTVFFPGGFNVSRFSDIPFYFSLAIFLVMLILSFKKVHPILIICLSAVSGIAVGLLQ